MISATIAGPIATCVVIVHSGHCSNPDRLEAVEIWHASEIIRSVVLTLFPSPILFEPYRIAAHKFHLVLCICTAVLENHPCVPTSFKHCQEDAALRTFQADSATSFPHTMEAIIVHPETTIDVQFASIIRINVESVTPSEVAHIQYAVPTHSEVISSRE
jgi:hypothetical protein